MHFQEVVRRRHMVRRYAPDPVDPRAVERLLRNAVCAPSAGFSQGWAFLVLSEPADVERFWESATPPTQAIEPDRWLAGMRTAPVIIVPLADKSAYLTRYAETDKGWTDPDADRWPIPYWYVDTGMASLLILQTAVDEGLGACFFGIPTARVTVFRNSFGIPLEYTPIGAISVGHPTPGAKTRGSASTRNRKPLKSVIHYGRWTR